MESVLLEGGLLLPGDHLLDGKALPAVHTNGGPDRHFLYTSPSVKYAELPVYTEPDTQLQRDGGWTSTLKIVLQCRQRPSYGVQGETVGWEANYGPGVRISQHFANTEIERTTKSRASIIPIRILVKVEQRTAVCWSSRKDGLRFALTDRHHFAKCDDSEFLMNGDAVRAVTRLDFGAADFGPIMPGALGTVACVPVPDRQRVKFRLNLRFSIL